MSLTSAVGAGIGVAAFLGVGRTGRRRLRLEPGHRRVPIGHPTPAPPSRASGATRPRPHRRSAGGHPAGRVGRRRGGRRGGLPGDLRPLTVSLDRAGMPPPGRLVLGRAGRRLVAAEPAQSVIVFGPTQSHKTSGFAVPALLEWSGPVLAASVKTDLDRPHHRPSAKVWRGPVLRPVGVDRPGLGVVVPAGLVTHLAGGPPVRGCAHRGGQGLGRRHGRRRLLVRHGDQDAGPPAVRRGLRRSDHGRRGPVGGHPRGVRGAGTPRRRRSSRGPPRGPVGLREGGAAAELHLHHGRDHARAVRRHRPHDRRLPRGGTDRRSADRRSRPAGRGRATPSTSAPRPTTNVGSHPSSSRWCARCSSTSTTGCR